MPGCCVPNCKNSSAKGFLMKHFPRNLEIRARWASYIPRANWIPMDYSCICEIHFSPEMWEKPRVDGKKSLKHNAIPNIFEPISKTVAFRQNNEVIQSVCQTVEINEKSNLASNEIPIQIHVESTESVIIENQLNPCLSRLNYEINWKKKYEELNDLFREREKTYDGVLRKCNKFHNVLKEKVKRLNAEKISLHKQCIKNTKLHSMIKKVFTSDQVRALMNKSIRGCKWSKETIKRAV